MFSMSVGGTPIVEIAIFWVLAFGAVTFFRTYHLASGYGWFDPWVQIGYAQTFPDTSFDFHYYKESRIISIAWTALVLQFNAEHINFFWQLLVAATSVITYMTFRLAKKHRVLSAIAAIFVALSFPLWGDYAGGGDYYNTLGNFIISLGCYLTFLIIRNLTVEKNSPSIQRLYFASGILFSAIALETPSGVTVLMPLQILLALQIWHFSGSIKEKTFTKLLELVKYQFFGFLTLIALESLVLLILNQNPVRLLTGPYFLIQSIADSSTTSQWAKPLQIVDFFNQPNLLIFATLLIVEFLYFMGLVVKAYSLSTRKYLLLSGVVPLFFYAFLLTLQILDRTIIFTTSYFLTPVILMGFIFLSRLEITLKSALFFASIVVSFSVVYILDSSWAVFVCLVAFVGLLSFFFVVGLKSDFGGFVKIFTSFLILSILIKSLAPMILTGRPNDFGICEVTRIQMRSELIEASTLLDQLGFSRGSLIMGADLDIIRSSIKSQCQDFNNKPLGPILVAISQTGFPSAAVLGAVKPTLEYKKNDFVEQNLAYIEGRYNAPTSCYINLTKSTGSSDSILTIAGREIGVDLKCPK